jgi:crossover junction endodeoxyribonuclease RuvC
MTTHPDNKEMLVLAIDPGFDRCGVAVIKKGARGETLLFSTCITTNADDDYSERLLAVGREIEKQIIKWQPDLVALEKLFFTTNQKTATKISEVRGMIIYLVAKQGKELVEYTPLQIKQTVAGFGQAGKKQVTEMVKRLIKLETAPKYDDEFDAIAIGLTACAHFRFSAA